MTTARPLTYSTASKLIHWTTALLILFIIPAGFRGTWETVKKVKKHYVILLPRAGA